MKFLVIVLLTFLLNITSATAFDLSRLYDKNTLEYWGGRYSRTTDKILNDIIWPALLSNERDQLGRKPTLKFPLFVEGDVGKHPLTYYTEMSKNRIFFPVFSLKFLDDLCTAYAWLQVNGYSLETISEYTAMLKYGKPPSDGFPPPLTALGIPEDALDDSQVDELALGHFVTARTFILLHEIGHIFYYNDGSTSGLSVREGEQIADRFAATVMQRTPLPPLGMLVYFLAAAHWSEIQKATNKTHPLSGERIFALADNIDDLILREKLRTIAKLIDDPEIRAGFVATGKACDLTTLTPRRPDQLPRRSDDFNQTSQSVLFNGVYQGEFVQFLDPRPMAVEIVLERRGDYVQGRYSFGLGIALIEGDVENRRLYFDWEWAGNYGQGVLEGNNDGSLTGTWGYHEARSGAGTWAVRRVP